MRHSPFAGRAAGQAPLPCDVLVHGLALVTGDPAAPFIDDAAVAVAGGRIVAVGDATGLRRSFAAARTIDGGGRLALPGLVNIHNHTPLMVVRGMAEDLGYAPAYTPGIPQGHAISFEDALPLARLGAYEMLRFGSTTIVDYYRHPEACAAAFAELGVRAFVGGRIHDVDMAELSRGQWIHDPAIGRATIEETLRLFERWDGAEDGLVRCLVAPHAVDTCSWVLLEEVAALAGAVGGGVHTHLAQSRDEVARVRARDGMGPVAVLDEVGLLDPRLVAAHCVYLEEEEIARLGAAGVRVAHAPLGNACAGMLAPILRLEAAGATIALGTDTKSGDMFEAMRAAIAVARIQGADYRTNATVALGWATRGGAAALGLEGEIGRIAPGFRADMVIMERGAPNLLPVLDGTGILVHSAVGRNVDTVMIEGRIVLEGGRSTRVDAERLVAEADAVMRRLWAASGARPGVAA